MHAVVYNNDYGQAMTTLRLISIGVMTPEQLFVADVHVLLF